MMDDAHRKYVTDGPTVAELREHTALKSMDYLEGLQPVFDLADGMRSNLLDRGWSEDVVEYLAGAWLAAILSSLGEGPEE